MFDLDNTIKEWSKFIEEKMIGKIHEIGEILEGNIYSLDTTTYYTDFFLEKQKNVALCGKNLKPNSEILEIGFNSGFSALLFLLSSDPTVKITCVDINYHRYTMPCFNILKSVFGDRINIILGDSSYVLPTLNKKYDLIHIDGCHFAEIADLDIKNSLTLIKDNGVLIMDDIELKHLSDLWNNYVTTYKLVDVDFETVNCRFHSIKKYCKEP
jgi:hypothetical protein